MQIGESQNQAALALLALSIFIIVWSTLLQKKIPWEQVMQDRKTRGSRAFFMHTADPGSVCWFGIFSGGLIILFAIIQTSLVARFIQQNEKKPLRQLLETSIIINIIVFALMLTMNSWFSHADQENARRGLFEHSLLYFVFQFTAIGLLYGQTSETD